MHGTPLGQLLDGIVGTLADLHPMAPAEGPQILGMAILDPDDEVRDHRDELVLIIGARGREALPLLRAAARSRAAAVAVKTGPAAAVELADAADAAGIALLTVGPQVRWDQLASLLRERLEAAELVARPGGGPASDSSGETLFALAEATALVTGGIVSIEDAGNRVLGYSRSDDAVDELRRLSILGWQGPESYMRMLREWGVLDRLRDGEHVVRVDARPELGVRARLAVGIRAGSRYLGTIWVQERFAPEAAPFAERAEEALIGAARLAATEILRRRTGAGPASGGAQLVELLTGRANTDLVAGRLGLDPSAAAIVIGFGGPIEPDVPVRELQHDQLRSVVSVYATAYHRTALITVHDDRVYAVLSGVRPGAGPHDPTLRSWVRDAVEVARQQTEVIWWAGISDPVPALAELSGARTEVDRVLDALARSARGAHPSVAGLSELRTELLLGELLDVLAARPELGSPGVSALVADDAERGGVLVESVLAYLDALGDVRTAAAGLHVHPNTLRHRLRRAHAVSGVDLDQPRERLACHLQLLLIHSAGGTE
ncbi:PucR family transcriptional regulator [Pseudonocardia spinosispora]|uniref:PucR family transcriptional regulator n=1 Tax=Pseudonocardia spinosispora TaxID=103441 RepID=UPI00041069C2|nr:helix-turn-helix domain-containing protein [Pseudonocardia spinosispora]